MNDADFEKLTNYFEKIKAEYDTPEKATALLYREGLVDENGNTAEAFREPQVA